MQQQADTSNYVFLCMTANFWGSARVEKKAIANCGSAGGDLRRYGYVLYRVHPKFEVCGISGDVRTPLGHPAIKVRDALKTATKTKRASR